MFLRVGSSRFALPLSMVREVLGLGQISGLPNMPAYFAGLINLRGKIVSAVHLKKSLNFLDSQSVPNEEFPKRSCVIITEFDGRMFGAIVDDVVEVLAFNESQVDHSVDGLSHKEMFDGVIRTEGQSLAPILNLKRALRIEELTNFADRASA